MKATSCASAPKASAISIIADAAPGEEPHTAVVPGSTDQRLIAQPRTPLAAITASTTARNSGQSLRNIRTMSCVITPAIRQPISAWAKR